LPEQELSWLARFGVSFAAEPEEDLTREAGLPAIAAEEYV
jgi:hypothetical protein